MISYVRAKLNVFTSYVSPPEESPLEPKKVLIIHCHPVSTSYSTQLSNAVRDGLVAGGHEIRLRRLYFHGNKDECYDGKEFQPILSSTDLEDYHNAQLVKNREQGIFPSISIKQAVDDLRWCNSLVFVYPTWWFNFPAMLKGYIDRTWLPGVAFRLPNLNDNSKMLIPGFPNIRKIGVVSTYGAPQWVVFYSNDNGRCNIANGLRPLCHPNCQLLWHGLYDYDNTSSEQKKVFLEKIKQIYSKF